MDAGSVPTDGGSPQLPTFDAGGGDAAQDSGVYVDTMDAGLSLDASAIDTPPIPVDAGQPLPALDAGHVTPDAGSGMPMMDAAVSGTDASVDAGSPAVDAGRDASVSARVCASGKEHGGYCWFLGGTQQSCNAACAAHGGYESSLEWTGTTAQGGSLERCDALLTLLQGYTAKITAGYRQDGRGLGCHVYQNGRWWLVDPAFSPAASYLKTRIVCSCYDK